MSFAKFALLSSVAMIPLAALSTTVAEQQTLQPEKYEMATPAGEDAANSDEIAEVVSSVMSALVNRCINCYVRVVINVVPRADPLKVAEATKEPEHQFAPRCNAPAVCASSLGTLPIWLQTDGGLLSDFFQPQPFSWLPDFKSGQSVEEMARMSALPSKLFE